MTDSTIDRRIIRTKKMIRDALATLMEEKGLEGITVRDLTTKAGINRGTFYLHYRDKYDLLEQSENEIIQEVNELTLKDSLKDSLKSKAAESSRLNIDSDLSLMTEIITFVGDNAGFMKVMLGPKGDPAFLEKLKELIRTNLFRRKILGQIDPSQLLVPTEYLEAYTISAHVGVMQEWIKNGMVETPREIALMITRMTFRGALYAVVKGADS